MKHSTRTPTKEEAARLDAIKNGLCVACFLRGIDKSEYGTPDAHHLLSGGKRIGHMATIGLCIWHHRAMPIGGKSHKYCREYYGPSLAEGSKPFHHEFGSDVELFKIQNRMIGE